MERPHLTVRDQELCIHIQEALVALHKAKMHLQGYTASQNGVSAAEDILFDLKQTVESIDGQLVNERDRIADDGEYLDR